MAQMISQRAAAMNASGIRKAFALAQTLDNPINMSIGQPDFAVPDVVKDAAIAAIREDKNAYTVTQGIQPLRAALAHKLQTKNGIAAAAEDTVMVTSAVSGALSLALPACIDAGDEVIIFDPSFVGYKQLVLLYGGVPVYVPLARDFAIDGNALRAAMTPRTRAIIFNTPANPTGHVATHDEIATLVTIAREHDVVILSRLCARRRRCNMRHLPHCLQISLRTLRVTSAIAICSMTDCEKSMTLCVLTVRFISLCRIHMTVHDFWSDVWRTNYLLSPATHLATATHTSACLLQRMKKRLRVQLQYYGKLLLTDDV